LLLQLGRLASKASSMFRITHDAHPLDAAIHSGETGMSLDRTQFFCNLWHMSKLPG